MERETLCAIGDVARRTGLTVKAVRFYSDLGIAPPTSRTPAGHRLYDADAIARLELARTLRELGLDLATIRRIADQELSLAQVAAAHAEALAAQIRVLRLRHAVLTAVAARESSPRQLARLRALAELSEDERGRLIHDFLGAVFAGLGGRPEFAGVMRSMTPELPADPEVEQVRAWVELAELAQDPDFRASMRRLAQEHAAEQAAGDATVPRRDIAAVARDQVAPALAANIDPASPLADPVVAALTAHYARELGRRDGMALRRRLLARLETVNDPNREQYARLLAVVNGWPAPASLAPALDWSIQALRVRTPSGGPAARQVS